MEDCPLCGKKAPIEVPEWSGGRYHIDCNSCGAFSTNTIAIKELNALRASGSIRISELQTALATADHQWHVTKHQKLGMIVLESGPPRELKKRDKKLRRRGTSVTVGLVLAKTPIGQCDETKDD